MGMQQESARRWCGTCGTSHSGPGTCPGTLRATGAERPAWRVNVATPYGEEAIGVLLAPSDDLWRARIITYPNVLWTLPGGRGTIKFVGDTEREAEQQAIAFIEEHVRTKRIVRRDGLEAPGLLAGPISGPVSGPVPTAGRPYSTPPRKFTCVPLRWGLARASTRGVTVNVSLEGMFIAAVAPEAEGQPVLIHIDLEGHTLAMRGFVMWNRRRSEPGRPLGMGVRLSEPPALYRSFVTALP